MSAGQRLALLPSLGTVFLPLFFLFLCLFFPSPSFEGGGGGGNTYGGGWREEDSRPELASAAGDLQMNRSPGGGSSSASLHKKVTSTDTLHSWRNMCAHARAVCVCENPREHLRHAERQTVASKRPPKQEAPRSNKPRPRQRRRG